MRNDSVHPPHCSSIFLYVAQSIIPNISFHTTNLKNPQSQIPNLHPLPSLNSPYANTSRNFSTIAVIVSLPCDKAPSIAKNGCGIPLKTLKSASTPLALSFSAYISPSLLKTSSSPTTTNAFGNPVHSPSYNNGLASGSLHLFSSGK